MSEHDLVIYSEIGTHINVVLRSAARCDHSVKCNDGLFTVYDSYYMKSQYILYQNGNV